MVPQVNKSTHPVVMQVNGFMDDGERHGEHPSDAITLSPICFGHASLSEGSNTWLLADREALTNCRGGCTR